ncbi:DNase I-like protein [Aaosphaeria arxii CBS 175.79]|uniref:DNase I-like protein n=1 Tax=Aaosphaeria arxii CBS 175.79 TaxID=1450172 RepID=A0A6A5Y8Y5_9PLEO|nr:DNase I-like protein [Aaosphaeria arxii CBS 175.79]KAF2021211.1 DNase I-like protein [Aaosphaeria arxii CBS 175.79]
MERPTEESTDGSSIKPVSSLRSHFENMLNSGKSPAPSPLRQASPSTPDRLGISEDMRRNDGRISLDIPRDNNGRAGAPNLAEISGTGSLAARGRSGLRTPWSTPKPRPSSMVAFSPPRSPTRSPPRVMVQSPKSPPPKSMEPQIHSPLPSRGVVNTAIGSPAAQMSASPQSNGAKTFKIPSRTATPSIESKQAPLLQSSTVAGSPIDPRKSGTLHSVERGPTASVSPIPPPINRAAKPKIPHKPNPSIDPSSNRATLAPEPITDRQDVSPFSTPPSSNEGSAKGEISPTGFPFPKNPNSQPIAPGELRLPPPRHQSLHDRSPSLDNRILSAPPKKNSSPSPPHQAGDHPDDRPGLPPRREDSSLRRSMILNRPAPAEPPVRHSIDSYRAPSFANESRTAMLPPPRRSQPTIPATTPMASKPLQPPKPPPPRNSGEMKRPSPSLPAQAPNPTQLKVSNNFDSDEAEAPIDKSAPALTDYPDSSQANRRPPMFKSGPQEIYTKYDTKLFAVCGEYICTTGYVTRVWSLLNGELLMSLSHGETVKATSVAFRPAKDVEDEGKRLWLGTNTGEMLEIDIPTQSVVYTKSNAHPRTAIIKIYRYASEMWSLDEDGVVHIWSPDETGSPTLTQTPNTFRIPRGHTFSIISGSHLWVAFGKDIRVFQRTDDGTLFQPATQGALSQHNVGEVTSGAILSSQPDKIFFGHSDGKVSIYAKKGFGCVGVVNVSLYKISSLVGVGDHLWAGYITGMVYVYDTSCTPWKVLKDWKAHEGAIAGILADRTSIWKLDRLQVASLGLDHTLRIWDGMLKDDWLEQQLQQHDSDYCDFREVSATVMTWNAGAVKPTSLRNGEDRNFYRDLLLPDDPADILVFGFQELVDLEDKKITAKSIFKKHKKKDAHDQDHMSHQYRAWRDHLIRIIDEYLPSYNYTLLHTANLIGLFTCIFVKGSERSKIRDVSAAQIKLGMGGRYGNKGALVVRFMLDDSSMCFINCHLAAGQTQTVHRNNDIASIMESEALPRNRSPSDRAAFFVGGGDGSMILDHEICILNGDLNYRIDAMPRNTVIDAVKQGNLNKLLDRDQLLLSRKRNPGFRLRAFNEAPINFAPTYKYDVGTDNYDTSEKKRSPAWCDRLLYRGLGRIKQTEYRRHDGIRVSDHRPVSGRFKIRVKTISAKRHSQAKEKYEVEFDAVKRRIAGDIKLDYLINVFGLSKKEAQRLLKGA